MRRTDLRVQFLLFLVLGLGFMVACTSDSVPATRVFLRAVPTVAASVREAKDALLGAEGPHSTPTRSNASVPNQNPATPPVGTSIPGPTPTALRMGVDTPTPSPWDSNLNLLLVGIDSRLGGPEGWRTDTIILLSIDHATSTVYMVSIPRDLWVSVPDSGHKRINTVDFLGTRTKQPGGEFSLLKRTIKENLGLRVDHCVRIDFEGFRRAIDVLGGITVEVECPLEDWFPDPDSPDGLKHMYVPAGEQHMDGELALQYVRSRRGTDDFDRARRQQKVLLAMRDRAMRLDILPKLPALWESFRPSIQTDLSLPQILSLARLGARIELGDIRALVIDLSMASNWTTPGGGKVLRPDPEKIHQALEGLLTGPANTSTTTRPSFCPKVEETEEH